MLLYNILRPLSLAIITIYFLINNPNTSSISANLAIEIWISIEKDKSEPVSNWEKVRIIFACVRTSL